MGLFDNAVVQPQGGWDEAVLKCATGQDMQDSISDTDKEINQRQSLLALIPPKTTRRRIARDYGAWWQDLFYVMSEMYSRVISLCSLAIYSLAKVLSV